MNIIDRLANKITCWQLGHEFKFDSTSLIGDWIRCVHCGKLDEYIPGTHEPKGYNPNAKDPLSGC